MLFWVDGGWLNCIVPDVVDIEADGAACKIDVTCGGN
jgi:hypothetical protein